ncbi:MAG: DNA polymerase III subunit delta' [Pseudomonadota bacterium]
MAEDDPPRPDVLPGAPHPIETAQLFGHSAAERAVLDAWAAGRLHHAWLLTGPIGLGKATLAYRMALARLATPVDGPVPSDLSVPLDLPLMRRARAGSEPRMRVLRRTVNEKTGRLRTQISVDDVREIKRGLALAVPDGGWRAVIVDAVDELTTAAANALLKVLEEPPDRTLMVLISHAPGGVLPTIRSRCRRRVLQPLGLEDLGHALAGAGIELPAEDLPALAELSGGSPGRAFQLAEGGGIAAYREIVQLFTGQTLDRPGMIALSESAAGRAGADRLAQICTLTELFVARLARASFGTGSAAGEETALAATLSAHPAQARLWAEAAMRIGAATRHARAVNLDPAQTILDMFLDLDSTLAQALALR